MICKVHVAYTNGSKSTHAKPSFLDARAFCRNGISYSGWAVARVEIHTDDGAAFAVWDRTWTPESQREGLRTTL